MTKEQLDALWEAVKEAGRYTVFLAVSTFVSILAQKVGNLPQDEVFIVFLTLVLRALDKYLHEKRKEESKGFIPSGKSQPMGILPF